MLHGTPSRSVPAGDADALAHGLREALYVPWTAAARDFAPEARERFDVRGSARRLVEVYAQLLTVRRETRGSSIRG